MYSDHVYGGDIPPANSYVDCSVFASVSKTANNSRSKSLPRKFCFNSDEQTMTFDSSIQENVQCNRSSLKTAKLNDKVHNYYPQNRVDANNIFTNVDPSFHTSKPTMNLINLSDKDSIRGSLDNESQTNNNIYSSTNEDFFQRSNLVQSDNNEFIGRLSAESLCYGGDISLANDEVHCVVSSNTKNNIVRSNLVGNSNVKEQKLHYRNNVDEIPKNSRECLNLTNVKNCHLPECTSEMLLKRSERHEPLSSTVNSSEAFLSTAVQDIKLSNNLLSLHKTFRILFSGGLKLPVDDIVVNRQIMNNFLHESVIKYCSKFANINMATRLQAFMWPVVARGHSTVVIGGPRCGKTMGYILPLSTLLLDMWPHIVSEASDRLGPVAVILCRGWKAVQEVSCIFSQLFQPHGLKVQALWGGLGKDAMQEMHRDIIKGSDVLVTTLPFLLQILDKENADETEDADDSETHVNDSSQAKYDLLSHCFHLVVENIDELLDTNAKDVKLLLKEWTCSRAKSALDHFSQQLILTATLWTEYISNLIDFFAPFMEPAIIISSPIQAAKAANLKTVVHFECLSFDNKNDLNTYQTLDILAQLIKDEAVVRKVLIIVHDSQEGKQLQKILNSLAIFHRLVNGRSLGWQIKEEIRAWKTSTNGRVLIATAKSLPLLLEQDFKDVEVLVNACIPRTKMAFAQRLSFMMDTFQMPNLAVRRTAENKQPTEPVMHLVVARHMLPLPWYLYDCLQQLSANIPASMRECLLWEDTIRDTLPLCHYLKAYGTCPKENSCEYRHYLIESDLRCRLPESGIVTVAIVRVLNATRYLVRLIEYKESVSSETVCLRENHLTMFMALQSFCSEEANLQQLKPEEIFLNAKCLVQHNSIWARAKVVFLWRDCSDATYSDLRTFSYRTNGTRAADNLKMSSASSGRDDAKIVSKAKIVTLFLMDEGYEIDVDGSELFTLPDDLKQLPPLIVELYLCNIQPLHKDLDWTHGADMYVDTIFTNNKCKSTDASHNSSENLVESTVQLTGNVVFSLSSTIWVSPLVQLLNVEGWVIRKESVRSQLIRCGFGCDNPGHVDALQALLSGLTDSSDSAMDWLKFWRP